MKRKLRLRSLYHLAHMHKKAMGRTFLPATFSLAIQRIASGIHPQIFEGVQHVRKVTFDPQMAETTYKGVYFGHFGGRQEPHYPEDNIDWFKYGWDGGNTCIIYPDEQPELWVVVHELGHWVDDIYFCKAFHYFKYLDCPQEKIVKFVRLRAAMQVEFDELHRAALASVTDEQKQRRSWYQYVPIDVFWGKAPTRYALFSFSEWIAESFRWWYLDSPEWLQRHCPHTYEFLSYALRGEVFQRTAEKEQKSRIEIWMEEDLMEEDLSYAAVPAIRYGDPQPQIHIDGKTLKTVEVIPWPTEYIEDVIEFDGKTTEVAPWPMSTFECPPE